MAAEAEAGPAVAPNADPDSDCDLDFLADPLDMKKDAAELANDGSDKPLTLSELIVYLLDIMTANKLTDAAGSDIWSLVRLLVPPNTPTKTFRSVKGILEKYEAATVQRLDVCPEDCIVYWDSTHLPKPYRHATAQSALCVGHVAM